LRIDLNQRKIVSLKGVRAESDIFVQRFRLQFPSLLPPRGGAITTRTNESGHGGWFIEDGGQDAEFWRNPLEVGFLTGVELGLRN